MKISRKCKRRKEKTDWDKKWEEQQHNLLISWRGFLTQK